MTKLSDVPAPSPEAYDRARAALHAAMAEPADVVVMPKKRFSWPRVGIAVVGAAAVAVAAVMVTTGGSTPDTPTQAAPPVVESPLVKLASDLEAAPLTGDSSLIVGEKIAKDKSRHEYYTVYTDAGQVFRGDSAQTLATAVVKNQDGAQPYERNLLAAARLAATGDVEKAKVAMLTAGANPLGIGMSQADAEKVWADGHAKMAEAFRKVGKELPPAGPRPTGAELEKLISSHLFSGSTQALDLGASNPEVRAGVLKLLATVEEVTVAETEVGGQRAFTLTAGSAIQGANGSAMLTVNAGNGLPMSLEIIPDKASATPSEQVKVDYRSSRVNLADVAAGKI
ncbi:hypothetical protein [Lentzea sp. NPDC060358]|uniref:hypothetical protein n=1 Tax=Lentzea sp. NPDC060358 TaxID=3347103 RepID=UPI00364FD2E7